MMSLRAFEAAARHLSFTRAAVELNLTPTAVSHQIKNLEEMLGAKLFLRHNNALNLSDTAEKYLRIVRNAILEISYATDRATEHNDEKVLTVQCLGTFAIKRLMPQLQDFRKRYPKISLRLRTTQSFENVLSHDFDVAIWHGAGGWPGVTAYKLGTEEVFPVCSPRLLVSGFPLRHPKDLSAQTIIRTSSLILRDEWPVWKEAAGISNIEFGSQISCDYQITAVHAAIDNLGIALGRSGVVMEDLACKRLIEPFDIRITSPFTYYLVTPESAVNVQRVKLFTTWFLDRLKIDSTLSTSKPKISSNLAASGL